ncbi:MAG: hypothetical protein EAZ11_11600 [Curvibacter sp.]|nr:MAG: hypothetical protein EAZ11_11600 [Curvibacter sp.]
MKGTGKLVLYLDFDGVLHHENVWFHPNLGEYFPSHPPVQSKLFEHVPLLEQLLEPYPEICIVLSTSWVLRYGCAKTAKNLGPRLRQQVIGATFHSRMSRQSFEYLYRGVQVMDDVRRRKPLDWLALDDTNEGWPVSADGHYIQTHSQLGIAEPQVLEATKARLALLSMKGKK